MARYRPVHVGIWTEPVFEAYSVPAKALFLYLITNEHCTESGVYRLTMKTAAFETCIPEPDVRALFSAELIGDADTLAGNVFYDWDQSVVFVKNFLKYNGRGNPEKLAASISHDKSMYCSSLWDVFEKTYKTLYKVSCRNRDRNSNRDRNRNSGAGADAEPVITPEQVREFKGRAPWAAKGRAK